MVHATDMLVHQPDLAALKMEAMKQQQAHTAAHNNSSHNDFGLLDLTVMASDFDSPPDTPSSSDDDFLMFPPPLLDRNGQLWDGALFQDSLFIEGLSKSTSSCSSGASSTVMWNVGGGSNNHCDLEAASSASLESLLSSPPSPNADLLHDAAGCLEDVFGLPLPIKEEAPKPVKPVPTTPAAASTTTTSAAAATTPRSSVFSIGTPSSSSSSSSSSHQQPRPPMKKPLSHPMVILSHPKGGSKRRLEDEMEAKKARARQTRDEISAKAAAAAAAAAAANATVTSSSSARSSASSSSSSGLPALSFATPLSSSSSSSSSASSPLLLSAVGSKLDNPELRRITHNVLERKRREDLKNSYQDLRYQIPELAQNDRAPTGQILLKAVEMIEALRREEVMLMNGLAAARAEHDRLRARIAAAAAAN